MEKDNPNYNGQLISLVKELRSLADRIEQSITEDAIKNYEEKF